MLPLVNLQQLSIMDTPIIPGVFTFASQQEVGLQPVTQIFFFNFIANVFVYDHLTLINVD